MDLNHLTDYQDHATQAIASATTLEALAEQESQFVGRRSQLAELSKGLKDIPNEQRAEAGQRFNHVRVSLEAAVANRRSTLQAQSRPNLDLSVPAVMPKAGHLHLTTQTTQEIVSIFAHLGMNFVEAPEVDYDWYAFESLNMGKDHPARDDWETFFVDAPENPDKGKVVLRPHTTNFQLRILEHQKPPVRAITVGKTFRRQSDASHTPMFHQFDGLVVDKGLTIGNLVATLEYFMHNYFGPEVKTRLRPYHFRFTEPSFEIDISCSVCGGVGCKLCKEGWLELGGAGMTHPAVLRNAGLDPEVYSGFAWGWGVERCFMIRHGITDMRLIYENDLRFLEQF
jgi:phenylalanyl-tRNA synthetase alpha chain